MNNFSVKGDEVRHGTYVYLNAFSQDIIKSLETIQIADDLLRHIQQDSIARFPMSGAQVAQAIKATDGLVFALCLQSNKACIGIARLGDVDWKSRHAQLSISIINEDYFNVDILKDAIQTLLQFAYWEANLNRIYVHFIEDNSRLQEAIETSRFTDEGRIRQEVYRDGRYFDKRIYSILRREWVSNSD